MYTSKYSITNVTVDVIAEFFIIEDHCKYLLLVRRKNDPFQGLLALPGGFIDPNEIAEAAAVRELQEETGCKVDEEALFLVDVASTPGRDPRGRTISIVYNALKLVFNKEEALEELKAGDDAEDVVLLPVKDIKPEEMAFDHYELIQKVCYQ